MVTPSGCVLNCGQIVRTRSTVDLVESDLEVAGEWVGCGDDVRPGLDLDRAGAACGLDEHTDGPAGLAFDPPAGRQGGEHDGQVGFDRVAQVVVDRRTRPAPLRAPSVDQVIGAYRTP